MRIFVTGIGVVSPLACGREPTWKRLVAGDCGIGPLSLFELAGCRVDIAAEVSGLRVSDVAPAGQQARWSRTDAMATVAAREALQHARGPNPHDVDLIVGGTTAGMFESERLLAALTREPQRAVDQQQMHSHPLSAPADRMHETLGPFRRVRSLCSACSGGANAIVLAAALLETGAARIVLAGGADGLCRLTFSGFAALGALDRHPCRPFDRRRAGLSLGEGAAFLVLETEQSQRERHAVPIAELRGWASAAEAHHPTQPEPDGATAGWVMRRSLERAGLPSAALDYINAHGTGTVHNDAMESAAVARCLGPAAERVDVSSCKGHLGHGLGAAGALEAAVTAMTIERGVVPPTVGLEQVDPACELRHVLHARQREVRAALSNSFGFGGADTTLVFATPGAGRDRPSVARHSVVVTGGATIGSLGIRDVPGSTAYAEPGSPPSDRGVELGQLSLDPARARRFDRAARLATAVMERALADADLAGEGRTDRPRVGAIVGTAFGSVGSTGNYLLRLYDKGARFASPVLFPSALPSALSSSAAIYLGLTGPAFSVADLATSAEAAVTIAAELIAAGESNALVVAGLEELSEVAERVSGPVCSGLKGDYPRREGAAAVVLEAAPSAAARGAPVRARLELALSWRGDGAGALARLPAPTGKAAVYRSRAPVASPALEPAWASAPQRAVAARSGDHEAAGGFALAAALGAIDRGEIHSALVLGDGTDRGFALLLVRPQTDPE